uniref:Uncharacterized protein n=1 Tax=viral metagenome TaxID=1070528 RepID=A0A6M3K0G3_9ZZZZ
MEEIDSRIFGRVKLLDLEQDVEEFDELQGMIESYPVDAFGIVNKMLNKRGFKIIIDKLK